MHEFNQLAGKRCVFDVEMCFWSNLSNQIVIICDKANTQSSQLGVIDQSNVTIINWQDNWIIIFFWTYEVMEHRIPQIDSKKTTETFSKCWLSKRNIDLSKNSQFH